MIQMSELEDLGFWRVSTGNYGCRCCCFRTTDVMTNGVIYLKEWNGSPRGGNFSGEWGVVEKGWVDAPRCHYGAGYTPLRLLNSTAGLGNNKFMELFL